MYKHRAVHVHYTTCALCLTLATFAAGNLQFLGHAGKLSAALKPLKLELSDPKAAPRGISGTSVYLQIVLLYVS
jgi:hypothetical protein